eukprot:5788614-Pleurochrysis_carterae.AAC.1
MFIHAVCQGIKCVHVKDFLLLFPASSRIPPDLRAGSGPASVLTWPLLRRVHIAWLVGSGHIHATCDVVLLPIAFLNRAAGVCCRTCICPLAILSSRALVCSSLSVTLAACPGVAFPSVCAFLFPCHLTGRLPIDFHVHGHPCCKPEHQMYPCQRLSTSIPGFKSVSSELESRFGVGECPGSAPGAKSAHC